MKVRQIPKQAPMFVPEAEITVPHGKGEITFLAPYFGSGNYTSVRLGIESAGLRMPTYAETVSLAYDALVADRSGKYSETVRNLMKSSWLRASNGILYVPDKGAYIQDSPELKNGQLKNGQVKMDESYLVRRLEAKDSSVRYVPFGFKTEVQTSRELEKNPFVIALAGEEGAAKLGEMADKFRNKPYVWSFGKVDSPTIRFAGLGSDRDFGYGRLDVDGGSWNGGNGYAFGVSK